MPPDQALLRSLTRSILLGTALGTSAVAVVGCATGQTPPSVTVEERAACERGIAAGNAAAVERVLAQYPRSTCIGPMLSALPPQVLREISPAVLEALPASTLQSLPSPVLDELNIARAPSPPPYDRLIYEGPADYRDDSDSSS